MYNFEKLTVWQKTLDFCELIYKHTKGFPKEEAFGLTAQLRRASTSILLNISEGCACSSKREFRHFLNIALCSQYEVATIIRLCQRLNLLVEEDYTKIGKLLHGLINSLKSDN